MVYFSSVEVEKKNEWTRGAVEWDQLKSPDELEKELLIIAKSRPSETIRLNL